MTTGKRNAVKVTILNEEYSIRSDTPADHTRAVAQHLDKAIRAVMASGGVVESNRAVVLAALAAVDVVTLFDEDTPPDLIVARLFEFKPAPLLEFTEEQRRDVDLGKLFG